MDVSSINSDLIRGNVTTIILKALIDEDRYGYDILKEIEVKSGGQYKLKQPTLYSCLKRLEKQGLISSYWGDESDTEGGRRRYYALTDAGRAYLNKMQSEYEYSRTILDSLLSEQKFDFENDDAPFDINSLRPYTKREGADDQPEKQAENAAPAATAPIQTVSPAVAPATYIAPAPSAPENTDEKQMFSPLDKGVGSYDEGYRHSSKSVFEMLGHIDEILSKDKDEPEEEEKSSETAEKAPFDSAPIGNAAPSAKEILYSNKPVEAAPVQKTEPVQQPAPTPTPAPTAPVEAATVESILTKKEETPLPEVETEDERLRRDNAKRALGIGAYQEKKTADTDNEVKEDADILGKIDKLVCEEPVPDDGKKVDLLSKVPIDKQLHPEKYAEKPVEKAPEQQKPLTENDPRLIFDKYNKKEEPHEPEKEPAKVVIEPSPVPPASTFSFRKDNDSVVNYRDAFGGLRRTNVVATDVGGEVNFADITQKPASSIDLKTKLFSEGYKLRTYSRENTENYYSMNYIKQNRINRDCYAITYILICFEVLIGWLIFKDRFSSIAYAAVCIAALIVPCVPFVIWTVNPDKRVRGTYNFRTSILNRCMLYLNLLVLVCLIGFFGFGANINDGASMVAPILVPALLLLNIPLSSVVYLILYKTKRYHIS